MNYKTIILDPGHGIDSKGIYQRPLIDCRDGKVRIINDFRPSILDNKDNVYREDFGTLAIAKAAAAELECMGHKVRLTRRDNKNASLYLASILDGNAWKKAHWKSWKWIREYAKTEDSDIFVSIHTNAGGGTGCSAFWATSPQGIHLCEAITNEINNQLNLPVRRIAKHRYLVLRENSHGNAILLECLFHDNINDLKWVLSKQGILTLGKAIADGISNFISTM